LKYEEGDSRGPEEVERELARLVFKSTPSGLRQKALDAASEARRNAVLTPSLRFAAVVCSVLLALVLGTDPVLRRAESSRLSALLDGRSAGQVPGGEVSEIADVLGSGEHEADTLAKLQAMAAKALRKERESDFVGAQKRLKGWLENETSEDHF
jgi:hypothetical protein